MLKILIVSNLYPPYYIGGYELGCQNVVNELSRRGHWVFVLTSTYGLRGPQVIDNIHRELLIYRYRHTGNFSKSKLRLFQIEWWNNKIFRQLIDRLSPDVIQFWNMRGLSMSIVLSAQKTGILVSYAISDLWLAEAFREDNWLNLWNYTPPNFFRAVFKQMVANRVLGKFVSLHIPTKLSSLDLSSIFFTSHSLREQYISRGLSVGHGEVIHWGIDPDKFKHERKFQSGHIKFLFVGRICEDKGLHTIIEAFIHLKKRLNQKCSLTIVGREESREYKNRLLSLIKKGNIESLVEFHDFVDPLKMPEVYKAHDVFLFPSIWEEPFSIVLLEAMASGLFIIGTTTGGSKEILKNGINSLTFCAGDSLDLARKIGHLLQSPELLSKFSTASRKTIQENFTLEIMVDKIESHLNRALSFHRGKSKT